MKVCPGILQYCMRYLDFNANLWDTPSFMSGLIYFLTTTITPVLHHLWYFTLLHSSLYTNLLSYTKMLNIYLYINIRGEYISIFDIFMSLQSDFP